jgi:hypothetical protein
MLAGSGGIPTATRVGYDTRDVTPPPLPMIPATTPAANSEPAASADSDS